MKKLLVLGDVHANWPALKAIVDYIQPQRFDGIINMGDLTVYATFPNKTVSWFRKQKQALSIIGNTDAKLLKILQGGKLGKPGKKEKRVMYFWSAEHLSRKNYRYLQKLPGKRELTIGSHRIGIFHGTYDDPEEALYPAAPNERFRQLAQSAPYNVHIMGHSHFPLYRKVQGVHFINPGSVGRAYDGDPRTSFAIVKIDAEELKVEHFRIPYAIEKTTAGLDKHRLPSIYKKMYRTGRKLN